MGSLDRRLDRIVEQILAEPDVDRITDARADAGDRLSDDWSGYLDEYYPDDREPAGGDPLWRDEP